MRPSRERSDATRRSIASFLVENLHVPVAKAVLEMGCGGGLTTIPILQALPQPSSYIGIDRFQTSERLWLEEQLCSVRGLVHHRLIRGGPSVLQMLPDETVDLIIYNEGRGLDPEELGWKSDQAFRLLASGGEIVQVGLPNRSLPHGGLAPRSGGTPDLLARQLILSGFADVAVKYQARAPWSHLTQGRKDPRA